jgi:hypothetical protein
VSVRATAVAATLLAAVAAVVIAANFFLLGFALDRNDPVGRLSPRTHLGSPPIVPPPGGSDDGEGDD